MLIVVCTLSVMRGKLHYTMLIIIQLPSYAGWGLGLSFGYTSDYVQSYIVVTYLLHTSMVLYSLEI